MTPRQDPYRVLGLVPGATAGEIRSAYRRLAKLNHPDTAGERSLSRFLAIKAAYEELVDGEGRLRGRDWPGRGGGAGAWRPSGSPASRASREAWRARRAAGSADGSASGSGGGTSAGPNGTSGANGASGAGASDRRKAGRDDGAGRSDSKTGSGTKADHGPKSRSSSRSGGRPKSADRRTARPGSTTYDEAAQPLDPSWEGGSWYGASSGSYWTLNPREYADPRKHGPEYQERARRAAQLESARRSGASLPPDPEVAEPASSAWAPPPASPSEPEPSPFEPEPSPSEPPPFEPEPGPLPRHRRSGRRQTPPGEP